MADVTEEVVEQVMIPLSRAFVGAGLALAGGLLIGYGVAEKRLRMKYKEIADDEIEAMRNHYRSKEIAREEKPELEKIVAEQGYVPAPIPDKEQVTGSDLTRPRSIQDVVGPETAEDAAIKRGIVERERAENVFDKAAVEDEWDYEEEVRMRRPDYPYVIHLDEVGEVSEMDSLTWTYYEGDEVLCNASDEVVTDVERSVGLANLDKFGHGSKDANVVYVRNVLLGIEIEIIKSPGRYDEEVLGLKHADENASRRKRHFDDDPR